MGGAAEFCLANKQRTGLCARGCVRVSVEVRNSLNRNCATHYCLTFQLEGLSLSSSTTETTTGEPEEEDDDDIYKPQKYPVKKKPCSERTDTESELEDIMIEFEARKLKERRAHEEIRSGRYRHPDIITSEFIVMAIQFLNCI